MGKIGLNVIPVTISQSNKSNYLSSYTKSLYKEFMIYLYTFHTFQPLRVNIRSTDWGGVGGQTHQAFEPQQVICQISCQITLY